MNEQIGALWKKTGKKGPYLVGNIIIENKKHNIIIFKNDKGENENRPDYKIYPVIPREQLNKDSEF